MPTKITRDTTTQNSSPESAIILNESLDLWYRTDGHGLINHISTRIESDFGYKVSEVVGKRIEDLFNNASDMAILNEQVYQNGFAKDFVSRVKDSQNRIRTVSFSIKAGQDSCNTGWIRDITVRAELERRERESYLNFVDVFNSNLDGLLVVEADTFKILEANITASQILHFTHEEMVSMDLLKLCDKTLTELNGLIEKIKTEGDLRFELMLRGKNDRQVQVEVSARMMQIGEGRLFQCNLRDVTRVKKLEKIELLKKGILKMTVTANTFAEITEHVCGSLEEIYKSTYFTYFSYNETNSHLKMECSGALAKPIRTALSKIDFSKSLAKHRAELISKNLHSKVISKLPLWKPYQKFLGLSAFKSFVSIPMRRTNGNTIGVFLGFQLSHLGFLEEDMGLIEQSVQLFGMAYEKLENETRLIENESRYRKLVDNSPMAIAIHSDNRIKYLNDEACRLLKIKNRKKAIGLSIQLFIHHESTATLYQRLKLISEGKRVPIIEAKLLDSNGQTLEVMLQGTQVVFNYENAIQVVFSDISRLKKTERELSKSQELFELAMRGSEAGVWDYYDIPNGKVWWSPKTYRILGYQPNEFPVTIEMFRALVHPEDREWVLPLIRAKITQGKRFRAEYRIMTKSGGYKWFFGSGQGQLDVAGNPKRMVGSIIDINESKKIQQKVKDREQLLNRTGKVAKVGGWELILEKRQLTWTDQSYIIHDLEIGSKIDTDKILKFYHPEDRLIVTNAVEKCITEGTSFQLTIRLTTAMQRQIWLEISCLPIYEKDNIIKLVGTFRDVTVERNQEEAVRESERKLKNANQLALLGNWEWNVEKDELYWSDELYNIFGYDRSVQPTMELFEGLLHPDSREMYSNSLKNALRDEPSQKADLMIVQPYTGAKKHIAIQSINQLDSQGRVIKVMGTVQDITERKKLEIAYNRRNLYTQVLLELGMIGSMANNDWFLMNEYCKILISKLRFDWVWVSDISGLSEDPIRPLAQAFNPEHKDSPLISGLLKAEASGPSRSIYTTNQKKAVEDIQSCEENLQWKEVMMAFGFQSYIGLPYYQDNMIKGTLNIYSIKKLDFDVNISNFLNQFALELGTSTYAIELKRNTNELNEFNRLLINSLDVVSVSMDMFNGKTSIFGNTESLVGYEHDHFGQLIKNGHEQVHRNDLADVMNEVEQSKSHDGYVDIDFRVKRKDGTYSWLNAIGKIYWQRNVMRKVVGILINMDQRKKEEIDQIKAQIQGRDNERIRIAKEIHDSLGQILTVASLSLDVLSDDITVLKKERQELFHDAYKMVNEAIEESRGISHDLMSSLLMDFGLVKSIASDVNRLDKSSPIKFSFTHNEACERRYSREIETNLYNIAREALKNVIRHSKAKHTQVTLNEIDNRLVLSIQDDGVGFDIVGVKRKGGIGMSSLKSRTLSIGGELYLESKNGCKVTVEVDLPGNRT